jgi:predicted PurR-regulated permease PerM
MWDDVAARIRGLDPIVWVGIALAIVLGYGARPIVRRLRFIPEDRKEKVVIISKSAALVLAAISLLLATGILG